jgi:hypothetical protein
MIPCINMGSKKRLVFAAQNFGNATGKSPQHLAFCIGDIPGLFNIAFLALGVIIVSIAPHGYGAIRSPPLLILKSLSL